MELNLYTSVRTAGAVKPYARGKPIGQMRIARSREIVSVYGSSFNAPLTAPPSTTTLPAQNLASVVSEARAWKSPGILELPFAP